MEARFLLWQFVFSMACGFVLASCPGQLAKSCVCEYHTDGLYVTCRNITGDLKSTLSVLEKLRVDRLTVMESPFPVLKRFPPLPVHSLRFIGCSIGEIEAGAFAGISEDLEELVLANNSLTKFPVLGVLPKLKILNLNYNQLKIIPDDALDGIGHLHYLRLEGNEISQISSNALSAARYTLELLDLSGNKLTQVPSDVVSNSDNLMYLDLSGNRIDKLSTLDFRNLPELIELRLNDNQISSVEPLAFKNVPNLEYFYLQGNPLGGSDALKFAEALRQLKVIETSTERPVELPTETPHSAPQADGTSGGAKGTEEDDAASKVGKAGVELSGNFSAPDQAELHPDNELSDDVATDTTGDPNSAFLEVEKATQEEDAIKLLLETPTTPNSGLSLGDVSLSPELFKVLKLLPKNYDVSKIPKEVIQSVSRGELPDFTLLPEDLRQHVMRNFKELFGESPKEAVLDEELHKKLPESIKTEAVTPSSNGQTIEYDGNAKTESNGQRNFQYYAIIAIAVIAAASVVLLSVICFSLRRRRNPVADESSLKRPDYSSFIESTPLTGAVRSSQSRITPRPNPFYR